MRHSHPNPHPHPHPNPNPNPDPNQARDAVRDDTATLAETGGVVDTQISLYVDNAVQMVLLCLANPNPPNPNPIPNPDPNANLISRFFALSVSPARPRSLSAESSSLWSSLPG